MRFVSFFCDRIRTSKGALSPHRKGKVSMKRTKLLALLTSISCVLLTIVLVGSYFTAAYAMMINKELGIVTTSVVTDDPSKNATYYASSFLKEDGTRDDDALTAWQKALCEQIQGEGSVLLTNNGALPMEKGLGVTVFGRGAVDTIYGGTGSGQVDSSKAATMTSALTAAGLNVNTAMMDWYSAQIAQMKEDKTNRSTPGMFTEYADVPAATRIAEVSADAVASSGVNLDGYKDAAIVVIGRSGGEGADLYTDEFTDGTSYFELQDSERELLKYVASQGFSKTIVLINSSNAMAMDWVNNPEYGVDACLWIGGPGQYGLNAVSQILVGDVNPSGRLVDTYSVSSLSSAAIQNFGSYVYTNADEETGTVGGVTIDGVPGDKTKVRYAIHYLVESEGIYVGYKYYETRYEDAVMEQGNASGNAGIFASKGDSWVYGEEVAYPFGYGMSYTTFEQALESVTYDAATDSFTVLVKVTNTGNVAGKEVVQVYGQQPYTEFDRANAIEKASVQLVGFGKTNVLQPGESETVSVTVDRKELTVYDEHVNKTYILEAGDYYLSVGLDAHDAVNNILAAKGYAPIAQETPAAEGAEEAETATLTANGAAAMDAPGDAAKVYKFTVDSDDNATYSVSGTGYKITNQFGDADLNSYGENLVTYLSRSDWQGTWPVSYDSLTANDAIINGLQFNYTAEAPDETAITGSTATNYTLANLIGKDYDDPMWVDLLNQLTLTDLAELVGHSGYGTRAIDSIGLPATVAADGPQGIKATYAGNNSTVAYTSEPVMAATFNTEILYNVGLSMGEDALRSDNRVVGWYGPAMNIHRTPYSGRNFEYYSEDGFLSGKMAAQEVAAARSKGLVVYIKHFALNDFETYRQSVATFATEQAIREIYLKGFQYAVEEGGANAAMTSFNRIGTRWAGAHSGLCNEVLRKEWGFVGVTLTDAVMANRNWMDVSIGLEAGNDTWLSSGDWLVSKIEGWAAEDGKLLNNLRTSAKNFLYAYANSAAMNGMNETSHVVHTTSWVETDMLIARIVLIVLTALFGLAMLVSYFMDVKKKAASADRKTLSIVAAVIAVLAAIFYIIIDTAATTKMNFDAVVLVLLLVSAVCYFVAGVKKIGLLAAAGLACTLVAWFRYLVTEINFRMDDLVLIFGGTSTIGALGVPFILSFILMLLAAISGAILMTGAMGAEKK